MQNFQHSIDQAGLKRLASIWLRQVQPRDHQSALSQLRGAGLGHYVADADAEALARLAEDYFSANATTSVNAA